MKLLAHAFSRHLVERTYRFFFFLLGTLSKEPSTAFTNDHLEAHLQFQARGFVESSCKLIGGAVQLGLQSLSGFFRSGKGFASVGAGQLVQLEYTGVGR